MRISDWISDVCSSDLAFTNGPPIVQRLSEDNISWRAGIDYRASDDVLVYANVSRGYKAGSFPSLAAASYISLQPVVQEEVTAYEAGLKATLADRDRKSTRLNSSHYCASSIPSSA